MPIILVHEHANGRERRLVVREGSSLEIHSEPRTPGAGAVRVTASRGQCRIDNQGTRIRCRVNGVEIQQASIHPGDRIDIGTESYAVEMTQSTELEAPGARASRRISASRLPTTAAVVDGRRGFLRRVGRMIAARSQRAGHLRALEEERDRLLRNAGRCALRADAGLGLPEKALAELYGRRDVAVKAGDVPIAHLERWYRMRQHAALLDIEIEALRQELGLGIDPGRLSDPPPILRADHRHQQERCFAALDDQDTHQLPGAFSTMEQAEAPPAELLRDQARPQPG